MVRYDCDKLSQYQQKLSVGRIRDLYNDAMNCLNNASFNNRWHGVGVQAARELNQLNKVSINRNRAIAGEIADAIGETISRVQDEVSRQRAKFGQPEVCEVPDKRNPGQIIRDRIIRIITPKPSALLQSYIDRIKAQGGR